MDPKKACGYGWPSPQRRQNLKRFANGDAALGPDLVGPEVQVRERLVGLKGKKKAWLPEGVANAKTKELTTSILAMAEHPSSPILLPLRPSCCRVLFSCEGQKEGMGYRRGGQRQEVKKESIP